MAMTLSSERGMTMVELLVSSAVMLTVLSVTTTVMTKSSTMFTQQRAALDGRNSARSVGRPADPAASAIVVHQRDRRVLPVDLPGSGRQRRVRLGARPRRLEPARR